MFLFTQRANIFSRVCASRPVSQRRMLSGASATLQHTSSSSSARRYGFACSVRPDDGSPRRAFRQSTFLGPNHPAQPFAPIATALRSRHTLAGGETTDDSSVRPLRPHAQTWPSQRARAGRASGRAGRVGRTGARTYQLGKELRTGRHRHQRQHKAHMVHNRLAACTAERVGAAQVSQSARWTNHRVFRESATLRCVIFVLDQNCGWIFFHEKSGRGRRERYAGGLLRAPWITRPAPAHMRARVQRCGAPGQ